MSYFMFSFVISFPKTSCRSEIETVHEICNNSLFSSLIIFLWVDAYMLVFFSTSLLFHAEWTFEVIWDVLSIVKNLVKQIQVILFFPSSRH